MNSDTQYKYQFKKWGFKKNIQSSEKQSLIQIGQERAKLGKSTMVTYKGKPIASRKLHREVKKLARLKLRLNTAAESQSGHGTTPSRSSLLFSNTM
jgi:hypothetical protein